MESEYVVGSYNKHYFPHNNSVSKLTWTLARTWTWTWTWGLELGGLNLELAMASPSASPWATQCPY